MTISGIMTRTVECAWRIIRFIAVWICTKLHQITSPTQTLMMLGTLIIAFLSFCQNQRTANLFVAQDRPLLDVTPIAIRQSAEFPTHAETLFSIANYSAFAAYRIRLDLKYDEIGWIVEWSKAEFESAEKKGVKGVVGDKWYPSPPEIPSTPRLSKLARGKRAQWSLRGALDLEGRVCSEKNRGKGIPVSVRVTWENDPNKGHVFDEIHRYTLICTVNTGGVHPIGRSFTFIPEGITAQKDTSIQPRGTASESPPAP